MERCMRADSPILYEYLLVIVAVVQQDVFRLASIG